MNRTDIILAGRRAMMGRKAPRYRKLTWVGKSSGNAVFDTGIRIMATMTFKIDFVPTSGAWQLPVSCWKSGYAYNNYNVLYLEKNASQTGRYNLAFSRTAHAIYGLQDDVRHTFRYDHGVQIDNSWYGQGTAPLDMEADTTLIARGPKFYSIQIWDSGELICDFVPAYDKKDNVYGLYDRVRDIFLTGTDLIGE